MANRLELRTAYQSPGLCPGNPWGLGPPKDGQRNGRSLYQEAERHAESVPSGSGGTHNELGPGESATPLSSIYTWTCKSPGGYLSRTTVDNNDWSLLTHLFRELVAWSFLPEVDLFASPVNAKLPRFCTNTDHPRANLVDALPVKWDFQTAYAFPPMPLIQLFLNRLRREDVTVLAVIPDWPKHPWYPLLLRMNVRVPRMLQTRPDLLSQGPVLHSAPEKLRLKAWILKDGGS